MMPKITVDNIDYNTEDLSDNGKAQLASLQFLETQLVKLQGEIAVYQTAKNAYLSALKIELEKSPAEEKADNTDKKSKMRLKLLGFYGLIYIIFVTKAYSLLAQETITAYFRNDSVNGFIISDAYETHNMGFIYSKDNKFFSLDLGIVSPDMHTYKNQYRVANRSFGEIVTLSLGSKNEQKDNYENKYFVSIRSTGQFGIDEMQDFMHRILGLQPVNQVNDLVRMPRKHGLE